MTVEVISMSPFVVWKGIKGRLVQLVALQVRFNTTKEGITKKALRGLLKDSIKNILTDMARLSEQIDNNLGVERDKSRINLLLSLKREVSTVKTNWADTQGKV